MMEYANSIGIQNPMNQLLNEGVLETVFVSDTSVVSSGDYQRYYYVDGKHTTILLTHKH